MGKVCGEKSGNGYLCLENTANMSKKYFESIANAIALEGQNLPMWDDKYGEAIASIKSAKKEFKKEVEKIRATSDIEEKRTLLSELLAEIEPLMNSDHHVYTETMAKRKAKREAQAKKKAQTPDIVPLKGITSEASIPRDIYVSESKPKAANATNAILYQCRNIGKEVSAILYEMGYTNLPDYEEDFDGLMSIYLQTVPKEFGRKEGGQTEAEKKKILTPFCKIPVKNLEPLMKKLDEIGNKHGIGSDGVTKCNGRDLTAIITILFCSREQLNFKGDIRSFEKFKKMICEYYNVEVPKYKMNQVMDRAVELQQLHYHFDSSFGFVSMKGVKI
ncbi:MAG: hypothetical protein MJY61_00125 [Bacteroidales bacterium]|nr:hypothetical protein [Bacteroidales bacterium]